MFKRRASGKHAQVTFTRDYRELVTGDLRPGHSLVLSYDPDRVVPKGEDYLFGDPARPIHALVRFRDGHPPMTHVLRSPGGLVEHPDKDVTGQGSMLKAWLALPTDAEQVTVWFSYVSPSGAVHYDSNLGNNYRFRFPSHDVAVLRATVAPNLQTPHDAFAVQVTAIAAVDAVSVRFRPLGTAADQATEIGLARTDQSHQPGWPIWSIAGVVVPHRAVLRFEVHYWVDGWRYRDDNSGHDYLAPQPEPDTVPPPPQELAEAVRTWM